MADRNSIIEKIKALFSKTIDNGCTEAEMMSAFDMAMAMKDSYAISDADLQLTKEESAVLHDEPLDSKDPHKIKWQLSYAIDEFCGVKIWRNNKRKGGIFTFCGMNSDVELAEWLMDHLTDFVHAALCEHLISCLAPKAERKLIIRGFVNGACERISNRMIALCKRSTVDRTSNGKALVVIKDRAISDLMKDKGIKLRSSCSGSTTNFNNAAAEAGRSAGDRASFGRPISGKAGVLRLAGARS